MPIVNQIELHFAFQRREQRAHHETLGILTKSWAPIGRGAYALEDFPGLSKIAAKYGKTLAQVAIRWHLDQGLIVFPKTVSRARLIENADVLDFALSSDDLAIITSYERCQRIGSHPKDRN